VGFGEGVGKYFGISGTYTPLNIFNVYFVWHEGKREINVPFQITLSEYFPP